MFFELQYVRIKLLQRNLSIDLCRADVGMPKDSTNTFNWHSFADGQDRKAMSCAVHRDVFVDADFCHNLFDVFGNRPIYNLPEHLVVSILLIALKDL